MKTVIASTLAVSLGIAGYGLSGHEARFRNYKR